jgi:hypothetical protein
VTSSAEMVTNLYPPFFRPPKLKIFYLAGPPNHPRGEHESDPLTYMQRPFPNGCKRPFGCDGYVTAVAAGQSQRFYSGVGIFNWYYLSSPPQIPRGSMVLLESGGLTCHKRQAHCAFPRVLIGTDFLNHLWIQVAVSVLKTPQLHRHQKRSGYKFVTVLEC